MTSLIDNLNEVLATLKTEIEGVLTKYKVELFLRFPTESERYPICLIVPEKVVPTYQALAQTDEYATSHIKLYLITRVPMDYGNSTLLTDLDTLLEKLKTLRFDSSKWRELQYMEGIDLNYEPISNWILQSAVINITIESQ